jgi:hypothetical protein
LLPATVLVLLLSRAAMLAYFPRKPNGELVEGAWQTLGRLNGVGFLILFGTVAVCWLLAFAFLFGVAIGVRSPGGRAAQPSGTGRRRTSGVVGLAVVLLLLSAAVFCVTAPYELPLPAWASGNRGWVVQPLTFGGIVAAAIAIAFVSAIVGRWRAFRDGGGKFLWPFLSVVAAGLAGGLLLFAVHGGLHTLYTWKGQDPLEFVLTQGAARVTTFGPPLVLLAAVLAIALGVALRRRSQGEELREWWSSVSGRLMRAGLIWLSVNLVALYGTALVLWAGPWLQTILASGWVATVAGGVLAGNSGRTGGVPARRSLPELLARVAPYVFVAGVLIGVSLLVHVIIDHPPNWDAADDDAWPQRPQPEQPPVRVSHAVNVDLRTALDREESMREQDEYDLVPDQALAVRQGYWLSFLNPVPKAVPIVVFKMDEDTERLLTKDAGLAKEAWDDLLKKLPEEVETIRKRQRPGRGRPEPKPQEYTRRELRLALAALPPGRAHLELRRVILDDARRVKLASPSGQASDETRHADPQVLLVMKLSIWAGICLVLLVLTLCFVDVNLYSLQTVYGNRLVRGYLGASRPESQRALDPDDDNVKLADLRAAKRYDGPFPIVNTALNLVNGNELAWQERKAASFLLTPVCCGWRAPDGDSFRRTEKGYGNDLSLGTAVTISGAAASPNSGYHSSAAVTILLTVCNARLGAWLGNPRNDRSWQTAGPPAGLFYLFRELLGLTDDRSGYVYLSDGDHFENLGGYELVRRRCRYVILCDADQDPDHAFDDLGNLIRKCRVDFGIRIEMDLEALRLSAQPRCSRWHYAVGRIRYYDVDPTALPDTLVYVKPSLTGDEPADVLHYAVSHPDFPHQTTADQFFNESQFESYRALGLHIAESVFGEAAADAEGPGGRMGPAYTRELFAAVVRRWFAMPPEYEPSFIASTRAFVEIQEALCRNPLLRGLTRDLYPELFPQQQAPPEEPEKEAARHGAEVHAVTQMLQALENAWLRLKLDVNYAHPLNRGWMDVFHRWTRAQCKTM